jgi:hypothetical protein
MLAIIVALTLGAGARAPGVVKPMSVEVSQSSAPSNPADVDAAKVRARQTISRDHVEGLFEDATERNAPEVRHVKSGMICSLSAATGSEHLRARGKDGAECERAAFGVRYVQAVQRRRKADTLAGLLAGLEKTEGVAVAACSRTPLAYTLTPKIPADAPTLPASLSRRYICERNGELTYVRLSVAMAPGWSVTQIATADATEDMGVEAGAESAFFEAIFSVKLKGSAHRRVRVGVSVVNPHPQVLSIPPVPPRS